MAQATVLTVYRFLLANESNLMEVFNVRKVPCGTVLANTSSKYYNISIFFNRKQPRDKKNDAIGFCFPT